MVKCPRGTPAQVKANLAYTQRASTLPEIETEFVEEEEEAWMEESEPELESCDADKRGPFTPRDELVYFFFSFFLDILLQSWEGKPCVKQKLGKESPPHQAEEYGESDLELVPCEDSFTPSTTDHLRRTSSMNTKKSSDSSKRKTLTENCEYLNEEDFGESEMTEHTCIPDEDVRFVFMNNVCYEGRVSKRLMEGQGSYYWEDGSSFKGDFVNGCITGIGRLEFPDLSVYEGGMFKAFRHGEGLYCLPDSPVMYSGQWWLGKKHGYGLIVYNSPSERPNFYKGQWEGGVKEGFGFRQYPSGSKYIGFWSNGIRHGKGLMLWSNNDIYRGEWKEGLMDGYGEYTWNGFLNQTLSYPCFNTYKGFWSKGKKCGKGTFELRNGEVVETIWIDDEKEGPGRVICSHGVEIKGNPLFQKNKPGLLGLQEDRMGLLVREQLSHSDRWRGKLDTAHLVAYIMSLERAKAISIPLYYPVKSINISPHSQKFFYKKKEEMLRERRRFYFNFQLIRLRSEDKEMTDRSEDELTKEDLCILAEATAEEEKQLKNFLTFKTNLLKSFYKYYAELAYEKSPSLNCFLLRIFLWQLFIDAKVPCSTLSLIDIDNLLAKEEYLLIENPHNPFVPLKLWQFFHILIFMSWQLYGQYAFDRNVLIPSVKVANFLDYFEASHSKNVLKTALEYFLSDISQGISFSDKSRRNVEKYSENKFEEKDMAPMEAMYQIYLQLGEPHSARDFINVICHKRSCGSLPFNDRYYEKLPIYKKQGRNTLTLGGLLCHITEPHPFNFPEILSLEEKSSEMDCKSDLSCLIDLKVKRVVECLSQICPGIMSDCLIVNMDYQLTFLEFYKAIVLCIRTALKQKAMSKIIKDNKAQRTESEGRLSIKEKTKEVLKGSIKKPQQLSDVPKKGKK